MSTELQVIKSLLPALSKPVVKSKKKSLLTGAGIGLGTLGALGGASVLSDHYSRKKLVNNAKDIIALSGAGAGGLGGLGLATLLTDNAWLKALGALGGGVAGGLAGKYLAGKYASENTHVPENTYTPENTHVPENNYGIIPVTVENMAASISPYAGDNYERKITNAEEMENKIKNELDINNIKADLARKARIRSILYGAGGATLGGLGGLGPGIPGYGGRGLLAPSNLFKISIFIKSLNVLFLFICLFSLTISSFLISLDFFESVLIKFFSSDFSFSSVFLAPSLLSSLLS